MLALATRVVTDYGKVLASVRPDVYAMRQSLLPHPKQRIHEALSFLLQQMPMDQLELREGLARGYVYLAQFVPDEDAAIIAAGQADLTGGTDADAAAAGKANRLINQIKADMEQALEEVRNLRP